MAEKPTRVAVFCMDSPSHFIGIRLVVAALVARGAETFVFTHRRFADVVEREGATFVDLFARHTVEEADSESLPFPSRSVSFAGFYAEDIAKEVAKLAPSLIVHAAFAPVGCVVARLLAIPYVTVYASHNTGPANYREVVSDLPLRVSPRCEEAVRRLRERHGFLEANPLWFAGTSSPFLNLYPEPPELLSEAERAAFEPVAFFGLVSPEERDTGGHRDHGVAFGDNASEVLRIYVCLGTVVWKYFPDHALAVLQAIGRALGERADVRAVISLGNRSAEENAGSVAPNVTVEAYVDQWRLLADADLFITHSGPKSVQEAMFHRVPMITYPLFGDQPSLARRCQELGLALPLTDELRSNVEKADVDRVLDRFHARRASLRERMSTARGWLTREIEGRSAVIDRMLGLASR
jgi:MGT family glycosyltransferase